eukprot:gene9653-10672_t
MQQQANNTNFSYSAQPHAAPLKGGGGGGAGGTATTRSKYRDENEESAVIAQNLMYDARVVRGNTYSAKNLSDPTSSSASPMAMKKTQPRRSIRNKHPFGSNIGGGGRRGSTPPPVDGRSHMVMQTEDFLEELTDRPIEEDAETQTQPFLDRPPSPLFVRAKIGYDVETQIENGDLFDFDMEVEPLLEVLVGKTLHVAMLEVIQEEELEAIRLQQQEYETIRNIELAEVQRLEAEIKRKESEKIRRIEQEKKRLEERYRLEELIAARQFSNQFLGELHLTVFDLLEEEGHFYDPVQREIEEIFMPEVLQGLNQGSTLYDIASQMAWELLEEARKKAKSFEKECIQQRQALRERLEREEAERKRLAEEARLAAEAAAKAAEEAAERAERGEGEGEGQDGELQASDE